MCIKFLYTRKLAKYYSYSSNWIVLFIYARPSGSDSNYLIMIFTYGSVKVGTIGKADKGLVVVLRIAKKDHALWREPEDVLAKYKTKGLLMSETF